MSVLRLDGDETLWQDDEAIDEEIEVSEFTRSLLPRQEGFKSEVPKLDVTTGPDSDCGGLPDVCFPRWTRAEADAIIGMVTSSSRCQQRDSDQCGGSQRSRSLMDTSGQRSDQCVIDVHGNDQANRSTPVRVRCDDENATGKPHCSAGACQLCVLNRGSQMSSEGQACDCGSSRPREAAWICGNRVVARSRSYDDLSIVEPAISTCDVERYDDVEMSVSRSDDVDVSVNMEQPNSNDQCSMCFVPVQSVMIQESSQVECFMPVDRGRSTKSRKTGLCPENP